MKYESLHNHTKISDGTQTHLEVLVSAEKNGYGVVAFTDHDILPDAAILQQLRAYHGDVKWTVGVELTSGLPKALGGGVASMIHVLGLFVDPTNQQLLEHCETSMAARIERMDTIVRNLRGLGFDITADDCLRESGGESVGRPHIVAALLGKTANLKVMAELKRQAGMGEDVPPHQVPYKLFLSADAYVPAIYVDYTYWTNLEDSANLIRNAGGIAVLAHWFYSNQIIQEADLRALAEHNVIDGLEIGSGPKYFQEESTLLSSMAGEYDLATTIGNDAHRPQEMAGFPDEWKNASAGQTKRLIDRYKPNLTWSNL